jgi:predicted RND superfamily exporter protein
MYISYPKVLLAILSLVLAFLASYIKYVDIDASSETLLLKNDKDLEFTRQVNKTYTSPQYLVITYTPKKDLLDEHTLNDIKNISDKLLKLQDVSSITSILNVPLLQDPSKSIKDIVKHIPTIQTDNINKTLVKKEFLTSALYKDNLVSSDFKTTAILVNLKTDKKYEELLTKRNELLSKQNNSTLSKQEKQELINTEKIFKNYRDIQREQNHQNILKIRQILKQHQQNAQLFLGGVNMITDDMISFVKSDIATYGIIVVLLIIVIIWSILKSFRFVLISVAILSYSVIAMLGIVGMVGWEITVVSSNFISLQMIITMSLIIHLSVHYNEELQRNYHLSHQEIIQRTVSSMFKPCLYVILTTIAGFSSLIASNILPVINLGLIMSVGVFISLLVTFMVFPTMMILFNKPNKNTTNNKLPLTHYLAVFTQNHKKTIFGVSFIVVIFSVVGAKDIIVENSFIDYFKKDTEIYKGMTVIDHKLGGTTPLDIIIDLEDEKKQNSQNVEDEDDMFSSFEDEFQEEENKEQYWFTAKKMQKILQIHNYLDSLKEVGKVLSFATTIKVTKVLNHNKELDNIELAFLYNELSQENKNILIKPYLNLEKNQIRFTLRIIDSQEGLRRDQLLKRIKNDIHTKFNIKQENIKLANMMVMYNNMLKSLYSSQIKTLSIVLLVLFIVFVILFRSIKIAFIASIANVVPVGVIFGFMGWANIPLDMMTITIAAISLGIAVDDTIHYLYRFQEEIKKDFDYTQAMYRSHISIGNAMFYTTTIIMVGFSVLILSNFYPTIYFGLLTMLAMFMAIIADLMLLPRLILWLKPY